MRAANSNMTDRLTDDQIRGLKAALDNRYEQLRGEIRDGLKRAGEPRLAEAVRDTEDEAFASVLEDLRIAEIARDVTEAREIEWARDRIASGTYGFCLNCDAPIPLERLRASPSARRCHDCQARFEREHGVPRGAKM